MQGSERAGYSRQTQTRSTSFLNYTQRRSARSRSGLIAAADR
jgi:hypothetical protein